MKPALPRYLDGALPRYLDGAMAAFRDGHAGRDLHLGYWDDPPLLATPCRPGEFQAAQAVLTRRMIGLAAVSPGLRVLDVACGLGGTLAAIGPAATGLNIDLRQLRLCQGVASGPALVAADACAMPFAAACFDRLLCVEAMFHFSSRARFFAEAARVLRPGGVLAVSDMLGGPSADGAPWSSAGMEAAIRHEYGPWPALWIDRRTLLQAAEAAGLALVSWHDWTAETLPSYRVIAPAPSTADPGGMLRWLQENGRLSYVAAAFQRR